MPPQAPPGEAAAGQTQLDNEGEYVNIGELHRFDRNISSSSSAPLSCSKRLHALVPAAEGVDRGRSGARSDAKKVAALLQTGFVLILRALLLPQTQSDRH